MPHNEQIGSPGMGITEAKLSVDPLATEAEATPGPNDFNPIEKQEDFTFRAPGISLNPENVTVPNAVDDSDLFRF